MIFGKAFKALAASRASRTLGPKSFYTYVNEPSMPILDRTPCWVKTANEAIEAAGLTSSK